MKKIYTPRYIIALTILIIGGIFSINTTHALSKELIEPINGIIVNKDTDRTMFMFLVTKFCSVMLNNGKYYTKENGLIYDANKSLFMYTLCTDPQIKGENKYFSKSDEGFSESKSSSYMLIEENDDGKSENMLKKYLPETFENTEDYIKDLFDTIVASYTSIYQANIYGYAPSDKTDEDLINAFSEKHFPNPLDRQPSYIELCGKNKEYSYSKTCKKMKEYISAARNTLKSNKNLLNAKYIYKKYIDQKDKECTATNKQEKPESYDMIACGTYGDLTDFVNLIYNELFFYSLFAEYYNFTLRTQPNFKNNTNLSVFQKAQRQQEKINKISDDIQQSKEAMRITIRLLKELQMTFPIHIGFLMYSEDVNTFSKEFNKLLTPIYTLYDLFRNVQIKD